MAKQDHLGSLHRDPVSTLFEPDTLASERCQNVFRSRQVLPERRLILAILDDAVQSFVATMRPRSPKELREFQEAQAWIMEKDSDWIFSFDSICNQLELDPDYLRSGLQKLKAEAHNGQRFRPARAGRFPRTRIAPGRTTLRQTSRRVFSANHDQGA